MRYYNLTFGSDNFTLDEENPFGLDINFQIQATTDASALIPTVLEIINAPMDYFTKKADAMMDNFVILNAGIKRSCLTEAQNITTNPYEQPLLYGKVSSSFSQWELTDTRASLMLNAAPRKFETVTFTVNKGEVVALKAATFLNQILSGDSSLVFMIDESVYAVTLQNVNSITYNYPGPNNTTFQDIIKNVSQWLKNFNLKIKAENNIRTIYWDGAEVEIPKEFVLVDPSMLLTQPTYCDAANVQLEMALNPNVKLGSTILIPTDINLFSGTVIGDLPGVLVRSATDAKILRNGYYKVNQVIHRGQSRNPDPRAWATTVTCIYQGM